jgi:pimeloyl-ACP methyl ester carboxylesterase
LLLSNVRVILPDLRGFGKSPVTEGIYSMDLLAGDVCAMMDQLNIPRAVLIGHSMGGM